MIFQLCCVLCALWNILDKLAFFEEDDCLILAIANNLLVSCPTNGVHNTETVLRERC